MPVIGLISRVWRRLAAGWLALAETFDQFEKHLSGVLPDEVAKAAEAEAHKLAKESAMTEAEKKAAEEVARLKELDLATASLEDATRLLSL